MANSGKYSGSSVSSPSLVINNANLDDEASYVCYATNSIGTGQSTSTVLDVVGNIPSVVVPQQQYNVDYGQTITLTCTVTSNPVHTVVYWQKIQNGQPTNINVVSSNKYSGSTVNTPSLTINNVVLSDEASYVCFATNGVGTGQSSQTTVDVAGGIPVVAILSNSYSVVVSGTVTLQCVVNANPLHTVVQWQRVVGGQTTDVSVGGNSRLSGSTVNSPSLIISQADFADEGNYICTATNAVGMGTSQRTFLDVTGTIPIVTVSQTQYNGDYGQSVTLVCTVSANPAETRVYWQRLQNGQMNEVTLNSGKYTGSTVGQPSLTVSALDLNDEGFYQCFAENSVGTGSSDQTFLDVLGNIPTVNVLSNTYTVILGNTITLGCEVTATPKETTVFWRRIVNGQLQDIDMNSNSNRYSGSTVDNPSLTIRNAGNSDEGNYVCYATNLAGTGSSSQTFLDVVGSIPVVSIVQSTYSVNIGNSITLACTVSATPPETNVFWTRASGNQQEQTVQMSNTNKYSGSSVSSPSLVILNTDLSDIANYRCHASNSVGTGRSDTTTLTVIGNIPIVTVEKSSYSVNYGESVTLVCSVRAAPQHTTVFWKKVQGGQEVDINMNTAKYSGSTVNQPSITIANTDMNDETFYICFASNSVGTGQSSQTYVDVLGNFPVVRVLSNSYSVLLGNTATLECVITASPAASIVQWYRVINGQQQTIDSSSSNYNTPTVNNPSLRVLSAANSDEGYYICSASNPVGTASSAQTFLDVTGNIPTVTVSLPNYNTNIGATVTLGCSVIATPAANSVYWKRIGANGQTIDIDTNSNRYDGASITNPSLVIYNPDLSDEGNYVCYASNAIGTGNSQQTFLDVTGNTPNVKVLQSLYTVNIGQSATLECTVTASPQHTIVYWQKVVGGVATTISTSSSNRYSGSTVNNPSLTISASQSGDEAYYICFASNEVGTGQSSQTYLDIIGSIPIVNIGSTSYNVNYGNSITLVCTVTANPVHNSVSWTKIQNGVQTAISIDGSKYSGATVSQPSLVISNAGNSDESFYVCSATNSIGKGQSSQTYLDVVGDIPVVQILSNYYSVEIGQSVNVECEVQADPLHNSVQWKRVLNGVTQNLDISNGNKYIGGTRNTPSLTIQSTGDSDEGYYICTATNAVGTGSSSQSYVDVTGSVLSVNVPQPSYSANYGQSVQLVCSVSGNPPATSVYWQKVKNGVVTTISANTNPNKYSGVTLSTPSLTVLNTDADDQAVYTCFAENAIGRSQSQQTQLQIVGSVPSVTIGQGYTVNLGSSVTIQCTVFATPSASSITWKKISQNGAESFINVANSAKYNGGTIGTPSLTVQNAGEGDEAYYVCSATNAAGTGTSSQSYLDVLGSLPVVNIPQPQYSVIVGNDLTIGCTIDANPAHTSVTWRKIVNGQPTQINTSGRISGSTVNNPSITITSAVASDVGYYVCYATNSVGTGSSAQTYLNVVGSIPVVTVLSTSYSVNIGNPITLQCTVSANPAATVVMWQRIINNNAVNVDMNSGHFSGSRVDSPSLVVSNAAAADEGYYICMASNSVGTGQSQQTFLDVVGSIPTVNVPVPNYTVNRGASVTLECQYSANPAATSVSWEKIVNGQTTDVILTNVNNKYGGSSVSSPSLIVNAAEESDQASYICKVTNAIGTGISTATNLDVVGNIPVVTASPLAYSVNIGDSVTVQCSVVADPLHTQVYWRKIVGGTTSNINVLNSNGKYDGSTVGGPSLIINNAAFGDQGTYVCYATNSVGTGQSTQVVVAVAGSVPSVTLSQTSFSASYGDDATLGCIISSNPTYTSVYWQKIVTGETPTTIDVSNTAKYSGSTVANPDLTIRNIGSGDIANYVCFAANSVGTGRSNQGPLNVLGSPPTVRISQTTYTVNIGNTVTIDCSVISNPTHTTVYWTRQTSGNTEETITIGGSLSTKYGGGSVVSPSLIIYNSDNSDQGTYICHATNLVGTGQSSQAFLNIVGNVPSVTATTVQSARVGSSVIITCTIVSNPAAIDVTWAKYINNQPTPIDIVNNNRLSGGTTTNPSLTINPVEQDDEGNYICQARNDVGTGSSNQVYLDIIGDPPSGITINPTKIVIEEGQTITATCLAQGSPSIIYTWTKEGSITIIKTGNILEINNAPRTALGTYTCRASNNYGSMEATTIVDVQYAPVVVISQTTSAFDGQGRQSINIPCSYMSNPAATSVFWTKYNPVAGTNSGNTKLVEIDGNKYQGSNLNSPSLTIYNLDRSDAGSYRCSASNIIGLGESNYVTLNIDTNAAPSFIRIRPSQVTVEEGNGYTLTCEADGDPSPLYEWYYKDIKIHEGPVLTISNAAYNNNDGLHTCKATNVVGSRQATVDVDVKYAPISAVDQASFNPALNNAVTLRCNTLANPSSTHWEWKYNGFDLDFNEKNYLVDMDSTADVGKYTCIAFNEVGQSAEIDFTVELAAGLTPAPKIVETTVSAGLTGGEIAAICLAVLFGILLIVIIIVCCVVQGCCGRKREKKDRYIEREVIRTEVPYRTETIPVVKEPSVVSVREVQPRISYMESVREVPRIGYVDDSYRYMSTQQRPYYLPVVEATYDDEEYRKQKKKKKSKKNRMYGQDLAADNEIYLEERVVGSVRGSRKGDEIITGPEMYFEAE
ncbi:hemicentin [Mytilus galloprovincialis]|nr:hemicentin [Mytilus galloprovincialis]